MPIVKPHQELIKPKPVFENPFAEEMRRDRERFLKKQNTLSFKLKKFFTNLFK